MTSFVLWLKGRDLEFLEHVDWHLFAYVFFFFLHLGDSFFSAQMYLKDNCIFAGQIENF
jgi:hypothetical protein